MFFLDFDLNGEIECNRTLPGARVINLTCQLPEGVEGVGIQYNVTADNFTQPGTKDVNETSFHIHIENLHPGRRYDIFIFATKDGIPSKQNISILAFTRKCIYYLPMQFFPAK